MEGGARSLGGLSDESQGDAWVDGREFLCREWLLSVCNSAISAVKAGDQLRLRLPLASMSSATAALPAAAASRPLPAAFRDSPIWPFAGDPQPTEPQFPRAFNLPIA